VRITKLSKTAYILLFLIIIIVIISCWAIRLKSENDYLKRLKNQYELISPDIAWMDIQTFLEHQKVLTVSFSDLKPQIQKILTENTSASYGVYIEDLTSGAWMGVNERDRFVPASLFKLPIMVGVLKKVERGELLLDEEIALKEGDLDNESGTLFQKGAGYKITVKELIRKMIKESDNTAVKTLFHKLSVDEQVEAGIGVGLPLPTGEESQVMASPKDVSNMLRSLYFSTYLQRPFSEIALSILAETDFRSQLPKGLPAGIKIAHKVGFYENGEYIHDCGIVYLPLKPYIICVMSKDNTNEEADRVISSISKTVYDYMAAKVSQ